jgi:serine/threonine protein kinase
VEFNALILAYSKNELDESALSVAIVAFFEQHPDINPTDLLAGIQPLLDSGKLHPKKFRLIARMVTELSIQRALDHAGNEQTLVMQHPPGSNTTAEETLIMPGPRKSAQQHDLTLFDATAGTDFHDRKTAAANPDAVQAGTVIKNRFELVEVIGKGGMGVVYKAVDLVKIQARDSHPHVAVKVLSDAFKKYSRAFIAMQREASKAQRLAHPNIATVHDFDRDGDIIFMTMELLDGQPFDELIGQLPPGGLPTETALRYIDELGNGLAYAHKQNLIHCDLKPANIFLAANGTVKLLDFGITRAFKQERPQGKDDTLFDPASLKALTPAYASLEMFKGEPPDPRDDIYALACVAYELLTGTHPYKKVAAHKAQELKLKPPPVAGLSRQQQKALRKALALPRQQRTASVEDFLQGMQPPTSHAKQLALAGAAILMIGGAFLIQPLRTQMLEEAQLALIQKIQQGDQTELLNLLSGIEQQNANTQAYLASILRKEIIGYYQDRINAAVDAKERHYDYPQAFSLLQEVSRLYPDSASLAEAEKQLQSHKAELIETLLRNYDELSSNGKDTSRVLQILSEAEPDHPLLQTRPTNGQRS